MDPATEFTRVFGDGDTSDAALEAKLQELCTYLLAFEERGEVFGRRNDRKIMECLAKLLSAYVEEPAETHSRLGKEKKGAAATTEPAAGAERAAVPPNVQAVPPRLHAGGASGSTPVRRGRSARGGAAGPSVPPPVSPAEGTASRAAPSPPPPAAAPPPPPPAPAPPRKRGINAMELVCRALWTYEEVTELHSEEGYGPMLAEAPMRALLAVLEPTPGAGAAVAPAREKPKGKDKGKGKAKAKATKELPEAEVPFELPPPQTLDPDRRLAAEESVKLIMLLGQVRRGGATASRRDLLIRRVFPGTGGLEARRIVIRLGGLAVLGEYTRACYKDGRIANALDALTLMQGLCQVSREQPGDAFVPALVSLLKDDAAVPLHHECLRCIASVYAACAEREGAVLALVHGNLPALLAKTLGRGVATETPAGRSSAAERSPRASESPGDGAGAASTSAAASLPVMDIASRLVLWFFSPNTPRVAHLCFREGMLDLLSDADVLIRACAADGSGGTTAAVTLLLQATEKALAHLYAPDAPATIDGGKKKDAVERASRARAGRARRLRWRRRTTVCKSAIACVTSTTTASVRSSRRCPAAGASWRGTSGCTTRTRTMTRTWTTTTTTTSTSSAAGTATYPPSTSSWWRRMPRGDWWATPPREPRGPPRRRADLAMSSVGSGSAGPRVRAAGRSRRRYRARGSFGSAPGFRGARRRRRRGIRFAPRRRRRRWSPRVWFPSRDAARWPRCSPRGCCPRSSRRRGRRRTSPPSGSYCDWCYPC